MSIVKAKLQAKKAEFISIDDVLTLLCKEGGGCSIEEAAQYLCDLLAAHGKEIQCLWSSSQHGLFIADRKPFVSDIARIAQGVGTYPWGTNSCDHGFYRAELFAVLAKEGVNLETATQLPKKELPQWALDCRAIRRYTQGQAARVLVGTDPIDDAWLGDEWQREIDRANMALTQAADDGAIAVASVNSNEQRIFNASDLRLWALSHGYDWPIPEMQPSAGPAPALSGSAPVASGEILKRLQDSERERNELRAEVEKLRAEAKHATDQTTALAEQAAQIGKLQADFDSSQNEIRELKSEIGQGKGVSTWQKLVIGMAVERYGYRLDASRSPTAADISAALGSVGIEVTAETVRNCLRTAADAHLSKRR